MPVTAKTADALLFASVRNGRAHVVRLDRRIGTMWNTVGDMRGTGAETVVLGGHRDAWVYGVTDNGSGIATLVEVARGFGALAKTGWHPTRTIVVAGFDAEEIGELGSRAYADALRDDLRANAIAYLNADENVTGATFETDAVSAPVRRSSPPRAICASRTFPPCRAFPAAAAITNRSSSGSAFRPRNSPTAAASPSTTRRTTISPTRDASSIRAFACTGTPRASSASSHFGSSTHRTFRIVSAGTPRCFVPRAPRSPKTTTSVATARARVRSMRRAVRRGLDLVFYGADGYARTSFPAIRTALATSDPAALRAATHTVARTIDATARLLEP